MLLLLLNFNINYYRCIFYVTFVSVWQLAWICCIWTISLNSVNNMFSLASSDIRWETSVCVHQCHIWSAAGALNGGRCVRWTVACSSAAQKGLIHLSASGWTACCEHHQWHHNSLGILGGDHFSGHCFTERIQRFPRDGPGLRLDCPWFVGYTVLKNAFHCLNIFSWVHPMSSFCFTAFLKKIFIIFISLLFL